MSRTNLVVGIVSLLVAVESVMAQSTLIPVSNRRDHVFSPDNGLLYMSTSAGTIARYNLSNASLIAPLSVGTSLNGLDVTPDGSAIYVAEDQQGATQGFVRKVNTSSGAVNNIPYNLTFGEGGAWDFKITNNGKGFLSTKYNGSGWVPFRELTLATDALLIRSDTTGSSISGEVRQNTQINRGSDRSFLFMTESNSSAGPIFTYAAGSDSFLQSAETGSSLTSVQSAVNRNGTLIAMEVGNSISILNSQLSTVQILGANLNGGLLFDSVRDILYAANSVTNTLIALDTNTWQQVNQWNIGEDISTSSAMSAGVMSISDNGWWLAMSTPGGVRLFAVPEPGYCGWLCIAFLIMKRRRLQNR